MRRIKYLFIVQLFIIPMVFSQISGVISSSEIQPSDISISADPGVSKYTITNYVTYDVEINMTLTQVAGNANYFFKYARLNDRQPNNPLTDCTPEYQRTELLYHKVTGYTGGQYLENHTDKFNNTYDSFNSSINGGGVVSLSQKYQVTLNAISFSGITAGDIGAYDTSAEIFDLYCNNSEEFYNITDPLLITKSNTLSAGLTTPIEKASAIFDGVVEHLTYSDSLVNETGASWAYANAQGDCSEYSSLMVTLLRIQGIPARKVTGNCISINSPFYPAVGDVYTFDLYTSDELSAFTGTNTPYGHAWVEYYVPNIGWIQCDPTWGAGYFNSIDYQRLNHNIGAYFFYPPAQNYSEFSNPTLFYNYAVAPDYTFAYEMKVTVTATDVVAPPEEEFPWLILTIILICAFIGFIGIVVIVWMIIKRKD